MSGLVTTTEKGLEIVKAETITMRGKERILEVDSSRDKEQKKGLVRERRSWVRATEAHGEPGEITTSTQKKNGEFDWRVYRDSQPKATIDSGSTGYVLDQIV